MEEVLRRKTWVCNFEKPNTSPNSLEPSTTVLSPYLKFGCLSVRLFYSRISDIIKRQKHSQPPVSLIGQIMWREFYYCVAAVTPNFDKMVGNSVCMQIDWDTNKEHLEAWTHGRTGYPFIDAIMRQLRQEGWIHHLARHAVACFLTRGDLWISWEEGQRVFEELLLDADWALNAGNWMWLSASAFFHQFFRVYSPVAFGKKTDPEGKFIRKYVPELARFPAGIIYEPWKANLETQKKLGCIIGKDYPRRIVVHEEISKTNIQRMSAAYKRNKAQKETDLDGDSAPGASTAGKKRPASSSASSKGSATPKKRKLEATIEKFLKKK
uniref:FAD_binding_7 domain-containing protein n=1 Tax=Anopheles maculatus TaxID=74869 RepID=A0A182STQ4_9DIPT